VLSASSTLCHCIRASRRQFLFSAGGFSRAAAASVLGGVLVPVLGKVGWRRRREGGVDSIPHAQCRSLAAHRSHCPGQLTGALAVQRPHIGHDKSILGLFAHHQIPAAVSLSFSIGCRVARLSGFHLI